MKSAPKASRIGSIAAPPGSVRLRAIASVSISSAPRSTSRAATVLLPLPMPPVRPTRRLIGALRTLGGPAEPAAADVSSSPKNIAASPPPAR